MNVTLSDSGTANGSVHWAAGIPTGIWLPDSANTLDGTFGGMTANGTWTLFLADLSAGGGTSTLNSWGLDINVAAVPEPSVYRILAAMLLLGGFIRTLRHKRFSTGPGRRVSAKVLTGSLTIDSPAGR